MASDSIRFARATPRSIRFARATPRGVLHRLFRHPLYKLLALGMAVAGWMYVQGDEVHETTVKAEVEWHLPEDLIPVQQLPSHVTLRIRGIRAATRRAAESEIQLQVDISNIGVGEHSLEFDSFSPEGLPSGVEVLGTSPSSVRFLLDEVVTRKVEVAPVLVGDPTIGYTVDQVSIAPSVVTVQGPRVTVRDLREVETQPIDVSGMSAEGTLPVALDLPRNVHRADEEPLIAEVSVAPLLERAVISDVPVYVWMDHGWRPLQPTVDVTVQGPSTALREVTRESTAAFVHLPTNPEREQYEAPYGPSEGVRLRVLHVGGDEVDVVRVSPPRVQVVRE